MGETLLLQKAKEVQQFSTPELTALIEDMEDTMTYMNGAGLAAPQIGVSLRVVIFGQKEEDSVENPRYPETDTVPYTILINPVLTPIDENKEEGWEGCLSIPGMRGIVPRYSNLHYSGYDQYGNVLERTVSGFHARVVQHECDHLDGVLYPMQMPDLTKFGYVDVLFPDQDIQDS